MDTVEDETQWEGDVVEYESIVKSFKQEKKIDHGVKRKRRPPNEQFSCSLCEQTFRIREGLTRLPGYISLETSRSVPGQRSCSWPCTHKRTSCRHTIGPLPCWRHPESAEEQCFHAGYAGHACNR